MYIFDSNAISTLGFYFPARFPTIWRRIEELVAQGSLWSVREVRNELDRHCRHEHTRTWYQANRSIFRIPTEEERETVTQILANPRYRDLVKRENILRALPSADPFVIAAGKWYRAIVTCPL